MSNTGDDEPFDNFDETNGLAPGLDGDDDGAEEDSVDKAGHASLFGGLIRGLDSDLRRGQKQENDDSSETPYSEEGNP
jgi:hypothetical protein